MKTNLEKNIKEQLEGRKVNVSENAWDKLTQLMDAEISTEKELRKNSSKWIFGIPISIAASVLILFGIYLFKQDQKAEIIVPTLQKTERVTTPIPNIEVTQSPEPMQMSETEKEIIVFNKSNSIKKIEEEVQPKQEESTIVLEPKPENTQETPTPTEQNIEWVVQSERDVKSTEKSKYVDPDMLLYSIENNQAVKQTNSDSRLVIIDFNK